MQEKIVIYTDGSCLGNPGVGGWGARLIKGELQKDLQGSARETTNNRMELQAVIEGLRALKTKSKVLLVTDSEYVKRGMEEWLPNWILRGWKTSSRRPVKNKDLWQELLVLSAEHDLEWQWVKGHAGDQHNEAVDSLAHGAALRLRRGDF